MLAVSWLRRLLTSLSPRRPGFGVWFMVEKVALRQVFLGVLRFPLSVSFHRGCPYSYITWDMNSRCVGGRSSETSSGPIDMNNTTWPSTYVMRILHNWNKLNRKCVEWYRKVRKFISVAPASHSESPGFTSQQQWHVIVNDNISLFIN
jgi:hypothetical protein